MVEQCLEVADELFPATALGVGRQTEATVIDRDHLIGVSKKVST